MRNLSYCLSRYFNELKPKYLEISGWYTKISSPPHPATSFSACNNITQPSLMNLQSQGTGPDEFLVLPTGPLTQPKNYSKLPLPTPGGKNRTDLNPEKDIITALGGDKNLIIQSVNDEEIFPEKNIPVTINELLGTTAYNNDDYDFTFNSPTEIVFTKK